MKEKMKIVYQIWQNVNLIFLGFFFGHIYGEIYDLNLRVMSILMGVSLVSMLASMVLGVYLGPPSEPYQRYLKDKKSPT